MLACPLFARAFKTTTPQTPIRISTTFTQDRRSLIFPLLAHAHPRPNLTPEIDLHFVRLFLHSYNGDDASKMSAWLHDRLQLLRPRAASGGSSDEDRGGERPNPSTSRVRRALFGPGNREENLEFARQVNRFKIRKSNSLFTVKFLFFQELARGRREASHRWNYDFENDRPLEGGRFTWEHITGMAGRGARTTATAAAAAPVEAQSTSAAAVAARLGQVPKEEAEARLDKKKDDNDGAEKSHAESIDKGGAEKSSAATRGSGACDQTDRPPPKAASRTVTASSSSSSSSQRQPPITGENSDLYLSKSSCSSSMV